MNLGDVGNYTPDDTSLYPVRL